MIEVDGLSFCYADFPVLDDLSFRVENKSIMGMLGKNGAGKTTLLKCIARLLKASSGNILIEDKSLENISGAELPKYIGYVPQYSNEEPMTVFDYVLLGRKPYIRYRSSDDDLYRVEELLHYMGIDEHAFKLTNELSGGEYQKVKIARAMVGEPKVLLLDEPTNNLDLKSQVQIMSLIEHLAKNHGLTVLMSVHDINLAFRYCDSLMLLSENKIFACNEREHINVNMLEEIYDVKLATAECDGCKLFIPEGSK